MNRSMASSNRLQYVVMACWYTGEYLGGTCLSRKAACWCNRIRERGFDKWSAMLIDLFKMDKVAFNPIT